MRTAKFNYLRGVFSVFLFVAFILFVPRSEAADLYTFTGEDGTTYYTNIPGDGRVKIPLTSMRIANPPSPSFRKGGLGGFEGYFLSGGEIYEPIIASASQRFTVDPHLVRAVIKAESNFDTRAVSPKGALGLMQLMPATAKKMAVANPFSPEENIHAGVRYLAELLQLLKGNLPMALAAYNAGPDRVIGRNGIPPIPETENYVRKVMGYYYKVCKTRDHEK